LACAALALSGCEPEISIPAAGDPLSAALAGDPEPAAMVEPEIVVYAPPQIEDALVRRAGKRVTLRLRWSKIEGASTYQVQVSKLLTFTRAVKDTTVKKTLLMAPRLEPAVYFWRVRAIGVAGEGTWSDVQVLDATQSGQRGARKARVAMAPEDEDDLESPDPVPARASAPVSAPVPAAAGVAGDGADSAVADTTLPLRLVWRLPLHQSVSTKTPVMAEGVATRGTEVRIGAASPITVTSTFSLPVPLTHGRNDLTLVATLGTQRKSLTRVVFYADPAKLAPIRERFEELRSQLDEIGAIRDELATTMRSLDATLKRAKDQSRATELEAEMTRINEIRREIDAEINNAIADLDKLLRG
jgi:hypothetical protein